MADAFTTEPISVMAGMGHDYWTSTYDMVLNHMGNFALDNGLSVVAVDKESGKVCGAFMGMDNQFDYGSLGFKKNFNMMKMIMH